MTFPNSAFPELVEGFFFFSTWQEGRGFDKLSQVGFYSIECQK